MLARPLVLFCAFTVALLAAACDDLSDYRGTYEGRRIIAGSFVRSCFSDETTLTLRFDPELAVAPTKAGAVNSLTTSDGTFQDTALEPISKLPHDHLSEFDFPGPQRLRNYMLLAQPKSGPLAGRDALVVISLLASEQIEVRVIARLAEGAGGCPGSFGFDDAGVPLPGNREYFGLWRFKR